jgi:hypothetical protein
MTFSKIGDNEIYVIILNMLMKRFIMMLSNNLWEQQSNFFIGCTHTLVIAIRY